MNRDENRSRVNLKDFDASSGLDRGAGKWKELSWYFVKMVFFLSAFPFPYAWKKRLLKIYGADVGRHVVIKPRVNIHMPWKLTIGNDVWIGEEVFILNFEKTIIGNDVCISQRTFLCCGNHDYRDSSMPYRNGPITLMDGCWVGAACFVGPDVSVGVDTVVVAGSVVTKSLDNNGIYRGNPAAYVKARWL
jgi:putative colanic acid biosynthesis acetyltransferase WcaF